MATSVTLSATGATLIAPKLQGTGPGGWWIVVTANTNSNGTAWNGSLVLARDLNAPGSVTSPCPPGNLTNVAYYDSSGNTVAAGTAITGTGNYQVGQESVNFDLYANLTLTSANTTVTVTVMPAAELPQDPIVGPITSASVIEHGTFGSAIPDTGNFAFPSGLTATGVFTASSAATITGLLTASSAATVTGVLTASSALNALSGVTVTGLLTASSNVTAQSAVTVTGILTASSALNALAGVTVTGLLTASSNITASSNVTVTGVLTASSAVTTTGTLTALGSVLCKDSTGTNFGIGYGPAGSGVGNTQTQGSSKVTAFTLNTATGQITFNNSALAAYTSSSSVWTCSAMASGDVVAIQHVSGGNVGRYTFNVNASAGTGTMVICNTSSASLSEAPVIQYAIIKGSTT